MRRRGPLKRVLGDRLLIAAMAAGAAVALAGATEAAPLQRGAASKTCPAGYVRASLSWGEKCLRAGEFCKVGNVEYHAYGFDCPASGLLTRHTGSSGSTGTTAAPAVPSGVAVGRTVLLGRRTKTKGCRRGSLPDRRCSPGAYYRKLTKAVICSPSFRTSTIRDVPQSEKFEVEREYGMAATYYGRSIEIDHIVPLELGGSNVTANLFPEPGSGKASYHLKDELENRLHDLVCSGGIGLRAARRRIASNWEALFRKVFGEAP